MRSVLALIGSVLLVGTAALAQPKPGPFVLSAITPNPVERGNKVAVTLVPAPDPKIPVPLDLWLKPRDPIPRPEGKGKPDDPFGPFKVSAESSVEIPAILPLGLYRATVAAEKQAPDFATSKDITINRGVGKRPALSEVRASTGRPGGRAYILTGRDFSAVAEDHVLIINDCEKLRLTPRKPLAEGENPPQGAFVAYLCPEKIEIFGTDFARFDDRTKVRVQIGDDQSDAVAITFPGIGQSWPAPLAAILTVLLAGAVVVTAGYRADPYEIAGRNYGAAKAMLLDKETDTYSLSKFQLYAWTAAAVFAYLYLFISWNWVQGRLEFPPIPENFPLLLGISVGTTAVAVGITATRGSKGAGNIYPSPTDFISSGGVVTGERLQFFVWTLLGVGAFIVLVIRSSPANLTDLPKIPENFLYLMGMSSAGYLGGKLARKAGPVIDTIIAQEGSPGLILEVHGRRLSRNARFELNGVEIQSRLAGSPVSMVDPTPVQPDALLEIVQKDDEDQTGEFASIMKLTMKNPVGWAQQHRDKDPNLGTFVVPQVVQLGPGSEVKKASFSVINPDGQPHMDILMHIP